MFVLTCVSLVTFSLDCLKWLLEEARGHAYQTAGDGMAPIHASAQAGKRECLEYLVKEVNISVRCRADDGATPAHFAAASGQVGVASSGCGNHCYLS